MKINKLIPRLRIVRELPQWITCSDKAAYHPYTHTIWLRKDCKYCLFHEFGHHLIEIITESVRIQCKYDALWLKLKKFMLFINFCK